MNSTTLRCLVVEDEKPAQRVLKRLIDEHPSLVFEGVCDNAIEASRFLDSRPIDLMFLDVELKGSIDGLDFLRIRKDYMPSVIITSVRSERAIEGFDLDVTHFLEKPLTLEKFNKAVLKVLKLNHTQAPNVPADATAHIIIKVLNARNENLQKKITYDEILYAETDVTKKGAIKIWTLPSGQSFPTCSYILDDFEGKTPLIRVHRSYVINKNQIDMVCRPDRYLYLKNGTKIDIGDKYMENIRAFLDEA